MAASARDIIDGLREEIRRLERRTPVGASFVACGQREVDALLPGGGFPRGAVSELAGGHASGKTALALRALAAAMGERGLGAFVDGPGELYPPAAAAMGVALERLLIVRPLAGAAAREPAAQVLWAAEAVLASGAFEAVIVDPGGARLHGAGGARQEAMLRRVRAAAEKGGSVALWLGAPGGARVPAAVRLDVRAGPAGVQVRRTFDAVAPEARPWRGVHHAA